MALLIGLLRYPIVQNAIKFSRAIASLHIKDQIVALPGLFSDLRIAEVKRSTPAGYISTDVV
jgi:hypothetical protein